MKKIVALTAVILMTTASIASAASALADGAVSDEAVTIYGGIDQGDAEGASKTLIGKLSKSTKLGVKFTTQAYALTSKHSSGNTQYGTAYDATAIFKQEVGEAALTAPTNADRSSFGTWTQM